jgi:hypothetical protein
MATEGFDFTFGKAKSIVIEFDDGTRLTGSDIIVDNLNVEHEYLDHFGFGQRDANGRIMTARTIRMQIILGDLNFEMGSGKTIPVGEFPQRLIRFKRNGR